MGQPTVSPGRIVQVSLPYGGHAGHFRPALVVEVINPETLKIYVHVHLNHKTDTTYAMQPYATALLLPLEVEYDESGAPGSWQWFERV